MDIKNLSKQLTDISELQSYCDSQYKLIVELSKKITQTEEENLELKKLLDAYIPQIGDKSKALNNFFTDMTDEQAICIMQLKLLKDISLERELTLDEAKRVEIFTKILYAVKEKDKEKDNKVKKLSDTELLSLLEADNSNEK